MSGHAEDHGHGGHEGGGEGVLTKLFKVRKNPSEPGIVKTVTDVATTTKDAVLKTGALAITAPLVVPEAGVALASNVIGYVSERLDDVAGGVSSIRTGIYNTLTGKGGGGGHDDHGGGHH